MNETVTLADVLVADGPHPAVADKMAPFAPLIGDWDVDITNYAPDGTATVVIGEWHFGWGLDGRAIVDIWIAPRRELRGPEHAGSWGITIRFYDPAIDAWRSTWLEQSHAVVMPFIGHLIDGEIVLEGSFTPGTLSRWIFSEIAAETFHWRSVESIDDGATWRLEQEMAARRAA